MKAMISQPMKGLDDEQIVKQRDKAIACLESLGYEVVNTLFTDDWYSRENMTLRDVIHIPICYLAKTLENMSLCDAVYFCGSWESARGCAIEHSIAKAYGVTCLYESED